MEIITLLKKIYDIHSGTMYSICLRYMTNEDEAKDALQEGFIKVFNSIGKFQFTGSFPRLDEAYFCEYQQ